MPYAAPFQQPARADHESAARGPGRDAGAGMCQELRDRLQGQAAPCRFVCDEPGQLVLALLLGRRRRLEQLLLGDAVQPGDIPQFKAALRERAGFVEGERRHLRQPFQCRATLDEDTCTS